MLTVIVAIVCSLVSGAAGAFFVHHFYVPRLKGSLRAELSGNIAAWQETASSALDARFSAMRNGLDDRILTAVEAAQPKLEGVSNDKPGTETDEEKKSRGVEGTFCY